MSIEKPRIRRSAGEARELAIAAARDLLLADGPGAVTLKAVAARIGMGHANLLHHFGSAAGLQAALMERMIVETVARVEGVVARLRAGEATPREIVDVVFDSHTHHGLARLTAWLSASGETERLKPLFAVLPALLKALEAGATIPIEEARRRIADMALLLILAGLGDGLIGPLLHETLGDDAGRTRDVVAAAMERLMAR